MQEQQCELCGRKLTIWNHAIGTPKCSRCARGRSPEAKHLKEGQEFVTSPEGKKRYLKATWVDIVISILLPGWGIIVGGFALLKGEKKRGRTMLVIGSVVLLLGIAWASSTVPAGVWRSLSR
jgi:hypothetical protein